MRLIELAGCEKARHHLTMLRIQTSDDVTHNLELTGTLDGVFTFNNLILGADTR